MNVVGPGYIQVSDVFARSQSQTDLIKSQSVTDLKLQSGSRHASPMVEASKSDLGLKAKGQDVIPGLDMGNENKNPDVVDCSSGQVAENLASLTQLLLTHKAQFTAPQLSEILNVPMDDNTHPLLEKLIGLLRMRSGGSTTSGVKKTLAELLGKQHAVAVKLNDQESNSGQQGDSRRFSQQTSYNTTAMSISEGSNNSMGGFEDTGANVFQGRREGDHPKPQQRRSGANKDPGLGLEEPMTVKAKVQNYLERFEEGGNSSSNVTSANYNRSSYGQTWN